VSALQFLKGNGVFCCVGRRLFAEYCLTAIKFSEAVDPLQALDLVEFTELVYKRVCQTIHPPQNHIDGTYTQQINPSFVGHVDDSVAAAGKQSLDVFFDGMADRTSKIVQPWSGFAALSRLKILVGNAINVFALMIDNKLGGWVCSAKLMVF